MTQDHDIDKGTYSVGPEDQWLVTEDCVCGHRISVAAGSQLEAELLLSRGWRKHLLAVHV